MSPPDARPGLEAAAPDARPGLEAAAPDARPGLEAVLRDALAAVEPGAAVRAAVSRDDAGLRVADVALPRGARVGVLAAGKAAAVMAAAFEVAAGDAVAWLLAVTKDGHGLPLARGALRETGHPVPDARSEAAGREAEALAARTPAPDALVVLLSGGASALWACPLPGISRDDLASTTRALLRGGASIGELNCVRKHLCALAGGRLAREAAAPLVIVLAISDVLGDRLDVIASGPCAPDPTTFAEALAVLERRAPGAAVPAPVRERLRAGAAGGHPETPKPGDPLFARVTTRILAGNGTALDAAARSARARGWRPVVVTRRLQGEARRVGRRLGALAACLRPRETLCLLAGGETTVQVRGDGLGGRSQELALGAATALEGAAGVALLAAGTDGTDGPTDAAGACVDGGTLARARARGLDAQAALVDNDAYRFFSAEGGLLRTGPTRTNVMDLVLARIDPPGC